jgi:hypothetical protein
MLKRVLFFALALILILISGCNLNDDGYESYGSGYEKYLTYSDYNILLERLEEYSTVNRSVIDSELIKLNVRQTYEYSFYSGSSYNCYTLNWNAWSSFNYDFIYYIDVDIWINKDGTLESSMCSYYAGR